MGILLPILMAIILWACSLSAQSNVKFDFSLEYQLKQSSENKSLFKNINWLEDKQWDVFRAGGVDSEPLTQQRVFVQYQQIPQWRSSWRGGVRWQPQNNLMFRVKGNRLSGHLSLPTKLLCAICKTHLETTLWKDGHIQFQLKSYFE